MKSYKAIPEYYDAEYEHLEMLGRDVPFFLERIGRKRQRILELAAGTGRAAIPMAQAGHRVVGADYDAEMLEIARRKRDSVGVTEKELSLLRRDVLKLSLEEKFDHVCIFFNTFYNFTTLEKQDQLLQVVRRHLKPRGTLWMDIYNPDFRMLGVEHQTHLDPTSFYVQELDRSVHRDSEVRQHWSRQVQEVTFHYRWFDSTGDGKHERVRFELTWTTQRELRMLLERNGFRMKQLYGDYDGSEVGDESPRLISQSVRVG